MIIQEYIPYYKRNLKVAVPVMLSQAGQVLVQQIDNMMVGAVGTNELAAASFANAIFFLGMVIGMGISMGLTPLVGHAFAANKKDEASSLLLNSSVTNFLTTILLFTAMYSISFLMKYMGQSEEVLNLAIPYYRISVFSIIPFMLFFTMKQFAEGIGNTINAMIITLIANVVNFVANYILIFGKLGAPALGLTGAGIGTLIARSVMALLFLYLFFNGKTFVHYTKAALKQTIRKEQIIKLFNVGFPISIQIVLEVAAFALGAIMIGWLGAVPLAAHQIAIGLASVTFMIVTGIGSGTTIRVSHQFSVKAYDEMKKAANASIHLVLGFMTFTSILFIALRNYLPFLYTTDPEVIALASQLLIMAAAFQIFDGLQVVMLGALRGLADVKYAMWIAFISYIIISLPLSYLVGFIFKWGAMGVWTGLVVSLGIASLLFVRRFNTLYIRLK